ncbi:hypothetical protein LMG26858_06115 [Achromobacter anxifer]|uniref:Uncharacterized protein n=1 Tax=Achromobacter anxifer TaxID=1287737 RepID=A0A6S7ETX0_9BURK|nr:hypothetical protein LMG26858_06115 [Achromobacter anxifer]
MPRPSTSKAAATSISAVASTVDAFQECKISIRASPQMALAMRYSQ